jgi:hypothetical protein
MTTTTIDRRDHSRSRFGSTRTHLLMIAALLAVAGVLFVWIVTGGGGGTTTHRDLGGPNEAARGAAVYSAVGGTVAPTSGPNEAARGQAVSSASGSVVNPGGPNETARGQASSTASGLSTTACAPYCRIR